MMKITTFAASMRSQFDGSYERSESVEILAGSGIMNSHLTDSKME